VEIEAVKGQNYPDSGFVENDYKIKFTPDIIMGNPGYSTFYQFQGVAQLLFSDILGDHQIYIQANLFLDLVNSSFLLAYFYMPDIIDYNIMAYHTAIYTYRDVLVNNSYYYRYIYRFRNYGLNIGASYPVDLFNRIQGGLGIINLSKEPVGPPDLGSSSQFMLAPSLFYVHDDALGGLFAPEMGSRYRIGIRGVPKISPGGIGFYTALGDFRTYLPAWNYLVLALRGTFGFSFGPNPETFYVGGTENWFNATFRNNIIPFEKPEDFAFMDDRFIYPVRGFSLNAINGSKYFAANAEMRFPLFPAFLAGPIPVLIRGVQGAFFYDIAGA